MTGGLRIGTAGALALVVVGATNCADPDPELRWGPLAVASSSWRDALVGGGADARLAGTLRITDQCVVVDPDQVDADPKVLVVWQERTTRWDPAKRSIVVDGRTLQDGDRVEFGGGHRADSGPGLPPIDFVNAPDPSCPTAGEWFMVHDVS